MGRQVDQVGIRPNWTVGRDRDPPGNIDGRKVRAVSPVEVIWSPADQLRIVVPGCRSRVDLDCPELGYVDWSAEVDNLDAAIALGWVEEVDDE